MKKTYNWRNRSLTFAVAISSLLFASCHFESDKDYKSKEGNSAADSKHDNHPGQEQHDASVPPLDAVRPGDSSQQVSPSGSSSSGGKDSSAKQNSLQKDSLKSGNPTSSARPKKATVQSSDWTIDNTAKKEMDKEGIYVNTDVLPEYPGGKKAIQKFIEDNIQYPQGAIDDEVEGTVQITFAVDENGKVYKTTASGKNVGHGLEQEAVRVINKMPKWKPGLVNGKPVKTRLSLPVVFLIS